jgi:hypothetical protein
MPAVTKKSSVSRTIIATSKSIPPKKVRPSRPNIRLRTKRVAARSWLAKTRRMAVPSRPEIFRAWATPVRTCSTSDW